MSRSEPTAGELLETIAIFLRDTAPQLEGKRFHAIVAANSLDIVRRELTLGPAIDTAAHTRLERLLGVQAPVAALDALLCDRLADGAIAIDDPALLDHLLRSAADEIRIDQPRYATLLLLEEQEDAAAPTGG